MALGQQENPARWSISISSGLALPAGGFANIAPERTAKLEPDGSGPYFSGFTRDGSSAAKTGLSFSATIDYRLNRSFKIVASFGRTTNPVNTQPITDFLLRNLLYRTNLVASDYELLQGCIGVDYHYQIGRFSVEAGPRFGLSTLSFPEYTLYALDIPSITKRPYGNKPTSNSTVVGANMNVNYAIGRKVLIGLQGTFLHAGFDYTIDLRWPGQSTYEIYYDKITYRVVSLSLNIGYRF